MNLSDYRNRHALYRSDPDLQAAHAKFPWAVTWDDHEVQNDYAGEERGNAGPYVADFAARRAAAYQAYYEHMPLRASDFAQAVLAGTQPRALRLAGRVREPVGGDERRGGERSRLEQREVGEARQPGLEPVDDVEPVLEREPELIERLWDNTRFFKAGLDALGFETGASESPITPVIVGDAALAMTLSDRLFGEGVFAQGIGFPTVPHGKARVRTIVTATHQREDLQYALDAFRKVGTALGVI